MAVAGIGRTTLPVDISQQGLQHYRTPPRQARGGRTLLQAAPSSPPASLVFNGAVYTFSAGPYTRAAAQAYCQVGVFFLCV